MDWSKVSDEDLAQKYAKQLQDCRLRMKEMDNIGAQASGQLLWEIEKEILKRWLYEQGMTIEL